MSLSSRVWRGVLALVAALVAAGAVWLLCRWVGYDLQDRLGNQPVFEILNDDYTQIIDPAGGRPHPGGAPPGRAGLLRGAA